MGNVNNIWYIILLQWSCLLTFDCFYSTVHLGKRSVDSQMQTQETEAFHAESPQPKEQLKGEKVYFHSNSLTLISLLISYCNVPSNVPVLILQFVKHNQQET